MQSMTFYSDNQYLSRIAHLLKKSRRRQKLFPFYLLTEMSVPILEIRHIAKLLKM